MGNKLTTLCFYLASQWLNLKTKIIVVNKIEVILIVVVVVWLTIAALFNNIKINRC